MTPDQFQQFLEHNDRATGEAIQKHVNGKIDALSTRLTKHMEEEEVKWSEIRPYLEGMNGLKFLWKILVAIAVGWMAIKSGFSPFK